MQFNKNSMHIMPEHIKITMRTIFYATYFKTMLTCEETDLVLAFSIFYTPKSWLSKSMYAQKSFERNSIVNIMVSRL